MTTRIKICGITRPEDARAAVAAGADAVGFVFAPTPRLLSAEQARALAAEIPPFVTIVGLFVDPEPEYVRAVLKRAPLSLLQFHGDETPEQCRAYGRPYIKGIRMRDDVDLPAEEQRFEDAVGLLLDAFVPDELGGAGRTFDWSRIPARRRKPVILAGGLTPATVGAAIRQVRPAAVDVSSGVEVAKGVKDAGRIAAFVRAVREAQ